MQDLKKASDLQTRLASRISLEWTQKQVTHIAGADCSYDLPNKKIGAAIVVLSYPEFRLIESSQAIKPLSMPYIPGFLNFREGPALMAAYQKIKTRPQLMMVDGNGIAHPRRMGLASYIGVMLDMCTVGCAKNPFYSSNKPKAQKGSYTPFLNENLELVGYCLRSRTGVKPIYVSPGNHIDFRTARNITLSCCRYKIPEPLRIAHQEAAKIFL